MTLIFQFYNSWKKLDKRRMNSSSREIEMEGVEDIGMDSQQVYWAAFIEDEEEGVAYKPQEPRLLEITMCERICLLKNPKKCYENNETPPGNQWGIFECKRRWRNRSYQ